MPSALMLLMSLFWLLAAQGAHWRMMREYVLYSRHSLQPVAPQSPHL
jgi:hypothetical protein